MNDVVKVVIYMRDVSKFAEMNAVYREYFEEGEEPSRVTVQAPSPLSEIDVEIEVTAVVLELTQCLHIQKFMFPPESCSPKLTSKHHVELRHQETS